MSTSFLMRKCLRFSCGKLENIVCDSCLGAYCSEFCKKLDSLAGHAKICRPIPRAFIIPKSGAERSQSPMKNSGQPAGDAQGPSVVDLNLQPIALVLLPSGAIPLNGRIISATKESAKVITSCKAMSYSKAKTNVKSAPGKIFLHTVDLRNGDEFRDELTTNGKTINKPESVLIFENKSLLITDDDGVHFFDYETKNYVNSISKKSLYGLEKVGGEIVSIDNKNGELLFICGVQNKILRSVKFPPEVKQLVYGGVSRIRCIDVDERNERCALVDLGGKCVNVVSFDGKFITKFGRYDFGRHGELGSFVNPAGVVLLPDGRILVADSMNHSVQIFSDDGKALGVVKLPLKNGFQSMKRLSAMDIAEADGETYLIIVHLGTEKAEELPGFTLFKF